MREANKKKMQKKEVQPPVDAHGSWQIRPYMHAPRRTFSNDQYPMDEIRFWTPEDDEPPVSQKLQTVNILVTLLDHLLSALHMR